MSATPGAGIAELISAELGELRRFVDVLKREQDALVGGHTDSLMALADEKVRIAERLSMLNQDRDRQLREAGLDTGNPGMKAWRSLGKLSNKTQSELASVVELAKESRRLNELNGTLVADRLQHNQTALNVLLAAAKQSTLYGPDGQTHVGSSGRTLGSA